MKKEVNPLFFGNDEESFHNNSNRIPNKETPKFGMEQIQYNPEALSKKKETDLIEQDGDSGKGSLDFLINDLNNLSSVRYKKRNDQMKRRKELFEEKNSKKSYEENKL